MPETTGHGMVPAASSRYSPKLILADAEAVMCIKRISSKQDCCVQELGMSTLFSIVQWSSAERGIPRAG